jgi:hypothetical protein
VRLGFPTLAGCTVIIAMAFPVSAGGPGWRIFGPYSAKQAEICFYSSADVSRSKNILKVWTKCLDRNDLSKAVKDDSTGVLSDTVVDKIAHSYVPPVASVEHLEGDQFIDAVFDEELANTGNLRPIRAVLLEIDCATKRSREISSLAPVDGQLQTSDTPQDWQSVSPLSGASSLSSLLCTNSPETHSPAQHSTHTAARSRWRHRSNVPR